MVVSRLKLTVLQNSCPFSSYSTPSHAFPTTYPPPLRPSPTILPFQWTRTPATSSGPPSTSTPELDSLCTQFARVLIIGEQPTESLQSKASIFSLPTALSEGTNPVTPHKERPKKGPSQSQPPRPISRTLSRKAVRPRQLSVPPSFLSSFSRAQPAPRKPSAPARVSTSKRASVPPQFPDHTHSTSLIPSPSPNAPTPDVPETYTYPGPTTPPVLSPDLFSEPLVVPPTPVRLSPGSSLMPIADPFLQFQPQYDYFSDPYLVSPFDYCGLAPELAPGGFFSKNAFDTPLGPDNPSHGIPAPMTSNTFERNFVSTYAMF